MIRLPTVNLLECLTPPPGFQLDCLVGTTYNLHPNVLLSIVVAATVSNEGDTEFDLEDRSKEEILSAIRDSQSKVLIICDHHGPFDGDGTFSAHEALVLNSVVKKEGRQSGLGGSLHSKFLLVLFKDSQHRYLGRVFVGSKNLTAATFQEFGLVMELEQCAAATSDQPSAAVARYLVYLRDFEAANVGSSEKLIPLRSAISIFNKARFRCVMPGVEIHWQGRDLRATPARTWISLAEASRKWLKGWIPSEVYVHSPWTRKAAVAHLMEICGKDTIFRIKCMDEDRLSTVNSPRVLYHLYQGDNDKLQPYSSHAKVYLFRLRQQVLVAFGSANLTQDGLGIAGYGCRPNAEMMVTMLGKYSEFAELADIAGARTEEKEPILVSPSAREHTLDFLSSLQVELIYDPETRQLLYSFDTIKQRPVGMKSVEIVNDMIEPFDGASSFTVFEGRALPPSVSIAWDQSLLYLISPVLRLREPHTNAEVHLILDLDFSFFAGRTKLKCLSYTPQEFVNSLARLMEVHFVGGSAVGDGDGKRRNTVLRFLHALRLERYIYRVARLRKSNVNEFEMIVSRVDRLLDMVPPDKEVHGKELESAIVAIRQCHEVLRAT